MLGYLILLFTLVPLIELAILLKFGQFIGVGLTIFIVIATGIIGAYLARLQGFLTLRRIESDINSSIMPTDKLFDGLIILCSGILLLTPGFITDLIGFLGLIPFSRNLFKKWVKSKARDMINQGRVIEITRFKSQ